MATKEQYDQLIKQIQEKLEEIENLEIDSIVREKELGSQLSFVDAKPTIIKIIVLFKRTKNVNFFEIPYNLLNNFFNMLNDATTRFNQFKDFNPNQNNPVNQRNALIQQLENQYDSYYQHTYPILISGLLTSKDLDIQQAKIETALKEIEKIEGETKKKSEEIVGELTETLRNAEAAAAKVGVSKHSSIFKTEADEHEAQAKFWIKWLIAILSTTAIVAFIFLLFFPSDSEKTSRIVQYTVTKLIILSTLFYGVTICNRNYKAHKHNALLNKHRQNALTTFETFSRAAGPDEQTKNAVLLEATHTIFSNQPTGYITSDSDSESPNKIVEIIKGAVSKVDIK